MYLSRNYRIINLFTGTVSFPFVVIYSLFSSKKINSYTEKHLKVLELELTFRKELNSYYYSNITYDCLLSKTDDIFIEFKNIFVENNYIIIK
jgi:hypothetical protein